MEKKIVGKECRFAVHIPTKSRDFKDLHLIKEIIHYEDGTSEPNIRLEEDFKRTFYVTKQMYRNHEQKKESEYLDKLTKYTCTQSDMKFAASRALGRMGSAPTMEMLAESPYLYGSDISSTSIIRHMYRKKYPDFNTPFAVATLDIETDMLHGTEDPIMSTVVTKGKVFQVIDRNFLKGYADIEARLEITRSKLIGKYMIDNQYSYEVKLVDSPVEVCIESLKKLHEWKPDLVGIWNISFDVPKMADTLKKYGLDPAQYFCDPSVPKDRRFCNFKKGSVKKITASGAFKPKKPSEQWHSWICPASFIFLDQMSLYRFLRLGEQEVGGGYGLDNILAVHGLGGKLSFKEADHLNFGPWHSFMQEKYPFEYCIYNTWDSLGSFALEAKNMDLAMSAPLMVGDSDYISLDKQTKRTSDAYHFYLLENRNSVVGTVPPRKRVAEVEIDLTDDDEEDQCDEPLTEEEEALKSEILSLRGWINYWQTLATRSLCLATSIEEDI